MLRGKLTTKEEFIEAADEFIAKGGECTEVFRQSRIMTTVKPVGFVDKWSEELDELVDSLQKAQRDFANPKLEIVSFNCTPLYLFEASLSRIFEHCLNNQPRLGLELGASSGFLIHVRRLKAIFDLGAIEGMNLLQNHGYLEAYHKMQLLTRQRGEYHMRERVRDIKSQTKRLCEHMKNNKEIQEKLRAKEKIMVEKYRDEIIPQLAPTNLHGVAEFICARKIIIFPKAAKRVIRAPEPPPPPPPVENPRIYHARRSAKYTPRVVRNVLPRRTMFHSTPLRIQPIHPIVPVAAPRAAIAPRAPEEPREEQRAVEPPKVVEQVKEPEVVSEDELPSYSPLLSRPFPSALEALNTFGSHEDEEMETEEPKVLAEQPKGPEELVEQVQEPDEPVDAPAQGSPAPVQENPEEHPEEPNSYPATPESAKENEAPDGYLDARRARSESSDSTISDMSLPSDSEQDRYQDAPNVYQDAINAYQNAPIEHQDAPNPYQDAQNAQNAPDRYQDAPDSPDSLDQDAPNRYQDAPIEHQDAQNAPIEAHQDAQNAPDGFQDAPNPYQDAPDSPNSPERHQDAPNAPDGFQDAPNPYQDAPDSPNSPERHQDAPNAPNEYQHAPDSPDPYEEAHRGVPEELRPPRYVEEPSPEPADAPIRRHRFDDSDYSPATTSPDSNASRSPISRASDTSDAPSDSSEDRSQLLVLEPRAPRALSSPDAPRASESSDESSPELFFAARRNAPRAPEPVAPAPEIQSSSGPAPNAPGAPRAPDEQLLAHNEAPEPQYSVGAPEKSPMLQEHFDNAPAAEPMHSDEQPAPEKSPEMLQEHHVAQAPPTSDGAPPAAMLQEPAEYQDAPNEYQDAQNAPDRYQDAPNAPRHQSDSDYSPASTPPDSHGSRSPSSDNESDGLSPELAPRAPESKYAPKMSPQRAPESKNDEDASKKSLELQDSEPSYQENAPKMSPDAPRAPESKNDEDAPRATESPNQIFNHYFPDLKLNLDIPETSECSSGPEKQECSPPKRSRSEEDPEEELQKKKMCPEEHPDISNH